MEKRKKRLYVDDDGRMVDEVVRRSGKKVQKITAIDSDWGTIKKSRIVRGKDGKRIKDKYSFRVAEDAPKSEYNRYKSYSGKNKYKKDASTIFDTKRTKERSVDSKGVASVTKTRTTRSGNTVRKYKDSEGNKTREVRNPDGKTIKEKSRENVIISGGGKPSTTGVQRTKAKERKGGTYKRRTVTNSGDGRKVTKIVTPAESKSYKRLKVVTNTGDGRNVSKSVKDLDGNIKKEVYKDKYGKAKSFPNFNKNQQYQNDLKSSTFKNFPQQVYDNANSSQNTQIDGEISKSKPLTTPQKKLMNVPIAAAEGALSGLGIQKKKD